MLVVGGWAKAVQRGSFIPFFPFHREEEEDGYIQILSCLGERGRERR